MVRKMKHRYKLVTVHNHPFFPGKKQVQRNRLMMAESLGRPLLRSECLHHCDEDTMDDRIENLKLMSPKQHVNHHGSSMLGKHHTVESNHKNSLAHKGKHHTVETRKRMSIAGKGRIFSVGHKKKISLNHVGMKDKQHTTETKYKMSLARNFPGI